MAATAFQVSQSVYYLSQNGPAKGTITSTVSATVDDQVDLYYIDHGHVGYAESQIHDSKEDLITYVTTLINALA